MTKPVSGNASLIAIASALGLGVAHASSFAPTGSWWAQLAVLALFAMLLRSRTSAAGTTGALRTPEVARATDAVRWRSATLGYAFGIGWFVAGIGWLYISMHVYGMMPAALAALAVLLFAAYLSIFPATAAWACARIGAASFLRFAIVFASALTLAEFARGYWFTGFPWLSIGYPQVDGPLAGFAPLLGVYGVGWVAAFVAALTGSMLAAALPGVGMPASARSGQSNRFAASFFDGRFAAGGFAIPAVVLIAVFGAAGMLKLIEWSRPYGAPIAVRLVQGNVPQAMKFDPARVRKAMQAYVEQIEASEQAAPRPALVLLPETAWTQPWLSTPPELARRIERFVARTGIAVAIGMPQVRAAPSAGTSHPPVGNDAPSAQESPHRELPRRIVTNSVLLLAPPVRDGLAREQQYDKHHLVPFGEFVPWGFRWFVDLMQIPLGDFDRGALGQPPFVIAGQRIAPNICYEDTYGEELIPALQGADGATILANVSNIAWFGDSHAIGQHLQIARMRSLELARPTIRATNTGSTAVIDHTGKVLASLAPFTLDVLDASIQGRTGLTPYAGTGNWPAFALAFAGIVVAGVVPARRRARANLPGVSGGRAS